MLRLKTIVFTSLFLVLAPTVTATENRAVPTTPVRQGQRIEVATQLRDKAQETRGNVAALHASRLAKRFDFYYARFESIIARLEARVEILKNEGKDTTKVAAQIQVAQKTLESAKDKGDRAVAAFDGIDPARFSEQKAQAFIARDLAKEARELYARAHRELRLIIPELNKL